MSAADKMFTTCGAACDMLVVRRPATMMSAPGIETSTSPDCAAASSAVVGVEVVPASPAAVAGSVWAIAVGATSRSEEHTSELQSLMRISYAVFCLKNKTTNTTTQNTHLHPTTTPTTKPIRKTNVR